MHILYVTYIYGSIIKYCVGYCNSLLVLYCGQMCSTTAGSLFLHKVAACIENRHRNVLQSHLIFTVSNQATVTEDHLFEFWTTIETFVGISGLRLTLVVQVDNGSQ